MPKVILISGGSDGLGKAIAKKLAPNNHVIILAHNREKLEAAAKEINCDFIEAELTDYTQLQEAVNTIINRHQTIDVLVNNAGIWMEGELEENEPKKIKELIDVNTTGTIFLTKAVLPGMRFRKSGQVINIISQDGLCSKKSRSVYHASKWAITGFTKCLQEDVAEENIKVTAVYPGLLKTNLFEKSGVKRDLSEALEPDEVASLVEYVINFNSNSYLPEVSINNKNKQTQNMDDANTPVIDLNIDPDMITTQNDSPQVTPPVAPNTPEPLPPMQNPNIIDITPGAASANQPVVPTSTHIDNIPPVEPQTQDITPSQLTPSSSIDHLSDLTPPEPEVSEAPVAPPTIQEAPPTIPTLPQAEDKASEIAAPEEALTQSSPLAEDPDLVKLIK